MEIVLLVLVLIAGFVFIVFGGVAKVGRDQNKAEANAEQILNEAFDGRDDVTFTLNMRTLKPETVVTGAKKRGYKLVHTSSNQYGPTGMVFEKVSDQPA